MATFTFSNKKQQSPVKKTVKKNDFKRNVKIDLIKHNKIDYSPEYYTYINADNEKCKYSGLIYNEGDSYIGKNIITHKVILTFHPTVNAVEHKDEYFSYIDINERERIFIGEPLYDLEKNTYYGNVIETIPHDEIVKIYKEA